MSDFICVTSQPCKDTQTPRIRTLALDFGPIYYESIPMYYKLKKIGSSKFAGDGRIKRKMYCPQTLRYMMFTEATSFFGRKCQKQR